MWGGARNQMCPAVRLPLLHLCPPASPPAHLADGHLIGHEVACSLGNLGLATRLQQMGLWVRDGIHVWRFPESPRFPEFPH